MSFAPKTCKSQFFNLLSIGLVSSLFLTGCGNTATISGENNNDNFPATQLTVSAAASLKNALEDIKILYQEKHPETEITYNFAASGSLQRQIEQGAPVDVFIAAAAAQMDAVENQGLILTETRQDLLENQIVLITPSRPPNHLKIDEFKDLTTAQITKIALGEPQIVPAGKYAQEVLTYFQISDRVNAKAVYGKDVNQVLNYVATGNVDAGIVYQTDAQNSDRVKISAIAPENSHSPVVYPMAVVQDSNHQNAALDLVEFLSTPAAQTVFRQYGFTPITQ